MFRLKKHSNQIKEKNSNDDVCNENERKVFALFIFNL